MNREETSLLIVDDDASILKLLANYIGSSFSFSTAASAEEAADLLSRRSFKLVMTDIKMPGASGVDLCRSINSLYPDTVVILMSGSAEVRDVIGAMKEGAYEHFFELLENIVNEMHAALYPHPDPKRNSKG